MKRFALVIFLLALVVGGIMHAAAPSKPGEAGVYETIDTTISCTQLQGIFDSYTSMSWRYISNGDARSENTRAYAKYALDRMNSLSCYG